jgi:hypothetical protein
MVRKLEEKSLSLVIMHHGGAPNFTARIILDKLNEVHESKTGFQFVFLERLNV